MTLDEASFPRQVGRSDIPVVVDFWAPWCAPCRMMAPAFEEAAAQLEPRVRLAKLNTEEAPSLAAQYNIRSIPTLAVFRSGREVARQMGALGGPQLVQWIQGEHLFGDLEAPLTGIWNTTTTTRCWVARDAKQPDMTSAPIANWPASTIPT